MPDRYGLVALGGELDTETLLEAYRRGIFPWSGEDPVPWYSPDPRLVLYPRDFHMSRSLKKAWRKQQLELRSDSAFERVMLCCATIPRPGQDGTWIDDNIIAGYVRLHELGYAHSVEIWQDDLLVGGLYGLSLGAAFFGESLFAHRSNATKLALSALTRLCFELELRFIDCQQVTQHMLSLGASAISRARYLRELNSALRIEDNRGSWSSWAQVLLQKEI